VGERPHPGGSIAVLDQLDEDPSRRSRVDEGHAVSPSAGAWCVVDELDPLVREALEFGSEVSDAVGDVVQRLAATFEEAPYGGIGGEGLQELDGPDEGHPNPLGRKLLGWGTGISGEGFEDAAHLVERVHGDRHVIERKVPRRGVGHEVDAPVGADGRIQPPDAMSGVQG